MGSWFNISFVFGVSVYTMFYLKKNRKRKRKVVNVGSTLSVLFFNVDYLSG